MALENTMSRHRQHELIHRATMGAHAVGQLTWHNVVANVPHMCRTFTFRHGGVVATLVNGVWQDLNPSYTIDARGCLHYGNNYFKHASNRFTLKELEAAFSFHLQDFLPKAMHRLAKIASQRNDMQYITDVLSNALADQASGL
uniref:Uncharacterized protein n=1 Tax=Leersia perrieri TaxID=77586 RepID=A0A0D9UW57_9ORYZ